MKFPILSLLIGSLVVLVACGDDSTEADVDSDNVNQQSNTDEDPDYDGPTYFDDIKPMMQTHCTGCHIPDDIAPFPLVSYEDVKATSVASHVAMVQETMPPWPPDDECADFQHRRGMSADDIDLFAEWIEADHPEGVPPSSDNDNDEVDEDFEGEPDLTLDWGFDYEPQPPGDDDIDDYRCFVIDPQLEEDEFVNMVHTRPDNAEIVHHMIAYVADEDQVDEVEALESEDDRPGYECFGGPRISSPGWLAGWAPGETPAPFEEGHGIRLEAGAKIIVQMHYNMLNDPQGTDRTEVDLYFLDRQEHPDPTELVILPLPATDLFLEAGDPEAEASTQGPNIPFSVTVHGIFPHMHLLGTEIRVTADTADGEVCLVDIPRWDFDWQGFYLYEEPIELAPPSQVEMVCNYDNSAGNQPAGRTPQDVSWGDGTYDEMCLAVFLLEVPPGMEDLL